MVDLEKTLKQKRLTPTLVLVAIILSASWMGAVYGGYFVSEWALVTLILAALALFVWIAGEFSGTESRWGTVALSLFGAYTAWMFASLLWSPNRGEAWTGAGQTLLYLLAFCLALGLVSLGASRRWVLATSALGPATIAALTLLILVPHLEGLFFLGGPQLVGTVGYVNGEAAFLLIPFWVSVYLAGSRPVNPLLRGLVLAGAVLSLDLAVLTQSRGAMVAMGISLLVFFLISGQRLRGLFALAPIAGALLVAFPGLNAVYIAFLEDFHLSQEPTPAVIEQVLPTVYLTATGAGLYGLLWGLIDRRWRTPISVTRFTGSIALAGSIAVLVFAGVIASERVGNVTTWGEQRWEAFKASDPNEQNYSRFLVANGSGLYTLWQVAWEDFTSHPLLGVGTQNYEATYYQLREQEDSTGSIRKPHSLPLEVLSERGIVGGALFFGFLVSCLGAGLWKRFRHLGSEGKGQVGAMVAAVTYWFVHSSVEWFWQLPAVTLPAVIYLALLVGPWQRVEAAPPRWPLRMVGAGVALFAVAAVAPLYVSDRYMSQSEAAADPEEALKAVERAQQLNPLSPEFPQREAELSMQIGDWNRAEGAYRNVIRLNPEHYEPYMLLAEYYGQRGDLATALPLYQKARALNPFGTDLNRSIIELLARVPVRQSVHVRFMSESSELGDLSLEVANSAPERERGLQELATLPPDVGVLFVWPEITTDPFWMETMAAPSDVAFIDPQGKVSEVRSLVQPNQKNIPNQQGYRLAIGANLGYFETNSIRPGRQAVFSVAP